ncbi:MAG: aspartate carbamoyltransferase catalytic subunit [Bacteriovoracaceae bacterium]|nr:aspartate carbamoyltransferase catalytic subunit [Bacteriovoracaceae bacterium]
MSKHFTALAELSVPTIMALLDRAQYFFHQSPSNLHKVLEHKVIANVFFEPSTRTRISFEMAAKRLGADVINFDLSNSSVKKGESLYDTLRTLEAIGSDALVLRHSDDRIFETLGPKLNAPLVNAGAGKNEHPSQGLLDLFTLQREFGRVDGLHIAILGDIRHSRVAGTMMLVASRLGMKVSLCSAKEFLPSEIPQGCVVEELDKVLPEVDAVMCLRNQFERHEGLDMSYEDFHRNWGLTVERAKKMRPRAIIMHPAPINRGVEIADELVEAPSSRIFRQMENGVFVRMSILEWILRKGN